MTYEADDLTTSIWYTDAAFAVHSDMKSHTGGLMSMGKGAVQTMSIKQKLNTKSSTEAELVAVDDVMNQLLWSYYFLKEQGYAPKKTIIKQDNQSTSRLIKNGKRSSGKRTRHIDIRYFFITDKLQTENIEIEYCSTDVMLADFFTKALQGKKFKLFRKKIMNL